MQWSGVNTKYSIHRAQRTPSTAYTTYCIIPTSTVSRSQPVFHIPADPVVLNCVHSHNCELTNEWSLSSRHTSLPNYHPQIDSLQILLQPRSIMASKWISKFALSRPPSASLNLLKQCLQVYLRTISITASKCISKLTPLRPSSSQDHGKAVHLQTRSIMAL